VEGWRTRRIARLHTIKAQISAVEEKLRNNQMNLARIGKRELIDEIERLRKRGRWVEQYRKERMLKRKLHNHETK